MKKYFKMSFIIPKIKKSYQRDNYSCGVHSVKSIVDYCGKHYSLKYIKKMLKTTPDKGTNQTAIEKFFKRKNISYKINTYASLRDIEKELKATHPVLVALDECEHWVVIVGFSKTCLYILDSSNYIINKRISKQKFLKYWDRWIMSVKANAVPIINL